MKLLSVCFISAIAASVVIGQQKLANRCVVSYTSTTASEMKTEKPLKIKAIGSIDISGVTEGTLLRDTYRFGRTGMFGHVEILFDDDMRYGPIPTDAMTIYLAISNGRKRTKVSTVGTSVTQTAFDDNFKRSIVVAYGRHRGREYALMVDCQGREADEK